MIKEDQENGQLISARTRIWSEMKTQERMRRDELQGLSTQELMSLTKGAGFTRKELFERTLETYRNYVTLQCMVERLDQDTRIANELLSARLAQRKKELTQKHEAAQHELVALMAQKGISLDQLKELLRKGATE